MRKSHNAEQYVCVTCGRTDSPEWRKVILWSAVTLSCMFTAFEGPTGTKNVVQCMRLALGQGSPQQGRRKRCGRDE